jgi:MFS family permease
MSLSAAAIAAPRNVLLRIAPFVLIIFFAYLTVGMPLAALPLRVHDGLAFGDLTVGIAAGVQSLVTLATRQFAGTLCDRTGAKFATLLGGGVAVVSGAIYLASTAPLGAAGSLAVLLLGRAVSGVGESLLMTGALAWAIAAVGAQNTGKVMVWVGIGMYAAIAAGAPLGIGLMSRDLAGGFALVSIGTAVFALVTAAIAAVIPNVPPVHGERLPFIKVAERIAPFGTGLALATLGFGAIAAFAALDFQHKGWAGAGFVLSGFGFAYIATRLICGSWPDRFGGARVALWSLVVECAGQLLLWLAPLPSVAFAGAILTGIGFALVFPSFGIEAVKVVPPASRGAALGAYVAFFDLGFALAGPVSGIVAGAFGYSTVFAAGAVCAAAAIIIARRTQTIDPSR